MRQMSRHLLCKGIPYHSIKLHKIASHFYYALLPWVSGVLLILDINIYNLLIYDVFSGLVKLDVGWDVVPDVARSWQVLDGGSAISSTCVTMCDGRMVHL